MNKTHVVWGVWKGSLYALGVGILLWLGTDSKSLNQFDDKDHTIMRAVNRLIKDLNDAVSQNPDFTSTVSAIFKDLKVALGRPHLTTSRVNWFMQCLDNCLHLYDDRYPSRDGGGVDMGLLGFPSNVSVEMLYKCNHVCVNPGTGNPGIVGR